MRANRHGARWRSLARETRFVHVFRRLHFMAHKWNVPVDDYFDEVRPLVAEHRYLPYLESYVPAARPGRPRADGVRRPSGSRPTSSRPQGP